MSLHQCSDDSYIESTRTLDDGTFAMDDLEEGRYRIRVTPPGGISDNNNNDALSNNNGGSATSNSDGLWRFVTKNVNGKKCAFKLVLFNEKKIDKDSNDF